MQIHDLSLLISHGMPAFPGEPTAGFIPFATIERDDCEMWQLALFTQIATHLDAPSHFMPGGRTVERVELERCVGPATIVRAAGEAELGAEVFRPYMDDLRRTRRALVATGWDARFGEDGYFTEFPSMTVGAAALLVEAGVVFLGLDTPSPHSSEVRLLHEALFVEEMVVAECLVGIVAIAAPEVLLVALPLKLDGLDGSPVRAIAIEGLDPAACGGEADV
ncbi:MAG: cyclase family protein [Actinobacteria bacterium]|nr:cyclase family protein [Actinomycetota bacterium]